MDAATRIQILDKSVEILHRNNNLMKDLNPTILRET